MKIKLLRQSQAAHIELDFQELALLASMVGMGYPEINWSPDNRALAEAIHHKLFSATRNARGLQKPKGESHT